MDRAATADETVTGPMAVGRAFIDAIARQDWVALEDCFAPDVQFRAVVPNEARPFRDKPDAPQAVEQIRKWFADADPLVLLDSDVRMIADGLLLRYRFTGREPDGEFVVEQFASAEMDAGRIGAMRLVCSGFLDPRSPKSPAAEPPGA